MKTSVCVLGDTAVDLIVHLPRFFISRTLSINPQLHPGGSGANVAVGLSRLGIETMFVGNVGDDNFGQIVINDFLKEKVDTEQLIIEPLLSTVCVFTFIDNKGERHLYGWPKKNPSHIYLDYEKINLERILQTSWIHTTGLLLASNSSARSTTLKILEYAQKNKIITSIDLNLRSNKNNFPKSYQETINKAILFSNYIFGSQDEFALLKEVNTWTGNFDELLNKQKTIVVRQGRKGSILYTKSKTIKCIGIKVKVVNTVGAGDVFNSGFIAAKVLGYNDEKALQWGNSVSAYTIMKDGARSSPTKEQLEYFLNENKHRISLLKTHKC